MAQELKELNKKLYEAIDSVSKGIAEKLVGGEPVTESILVAISDLYNANRCDREFQNTNFETAYHESVTSKFEFLLSRILYHYSEMKNLGWKIYLRRQKGKAAPDIRIDRGKETIAILELKAKVGWIQPLFSKETFDKNLAKFKAGRSDKNPEDYVRRLNEQIENYAKTFGIERHRMYFILPSLREASRRKYNKKLEDYRSDFMNNSGVNLKNFIILSKNLKLNLDTENIHELQPTSEFEDFVRDISEF